MEEQLYIEPVDSSLSESIALYLREYELMKQEMNRLMSIPTEREGSVGACRPS